MDIDQRRREIAAKQRKGTALIKALLKLRDQELLTTEQMESLYGCYSKIIREEEEQAFAMSREHQRAVFLTFSPLVDDARRRGLIE
jgi:hypothetical protein